MYLSQDGNHTIAIGALDGIFEDNNQPIYLEDLQNNSLHDLRISPYRFSSTMGSVDNRFQLRFTENTLNNNDFENDEFNIIILSTDNLVIKSTKDNIESVQIHDVLGRKLINLKAVNTMETTISNLQQNKAPLFIEIKLKNGNSVTKKIIF